MGETPPDSAGRPADPPPTFWQFRSRCVLPAVGLYPLAKALDAVMNPAVILSLSVLLKSVVPRMRQMFHPDRLLIHEAMSWSAVFARFLYVAPLIRGAISTTKLAPFPSRGSSWPTRSNVLNGVVLAADNAAAIVAVPPAGGSTDVSN